MLPRRPAGRTHASAVALACFVALLASPPAMAAGPSLSAKLKVSYDGSGSLAEHAQMQSCDTSNSNSNSCFYGSPTSETALHGWHATYDPLTVNGQAGSSTAPVSAQSLDWSIHTVSDFHNGDGNHHADCTLAFAVDPAEGPLALTASASGDGVKFEAEAPWQPTPAGDPSCFGNNFAYDFPTPDARSGLKAVKTVPFSQLEQATTEVPVSIGDPGVTQLGQDCTAAAHADNSDTTECDRQFNWTGKLNIEVICGTVSFSEGDSTPVTTDVHPGQTFKNGPTGRLEITLQDGSVLRVGPSSQTQLTTDCIKDDFMPEPIPLDRQFKLLLGDVWEKVAEGLGGSAYPEVDTERAVAGNRGKVAVPGFAAKSPIRGAALAATGGGSMTVSKQPNGDVIAHSISGKGFVQIPGKPEFDYLAGQSALITASGVKLTSKWPAADRALVPAGELPPTISGLAISKATQGKKAQVRFKLDRKASVVVQVLKGKKVVVTKTVSGKKGKNSVKPLKKKLGKGRYTVRVTATDLKRVSIAEKKLHLKK